MAWIYIVLSLFLLALIYMRFEAGYLKTEKVDLAKSKTGLKIIQLSDIHIRLLKVNPAKVRDVIEREKPDLLIFTGDYIDKPKEKKGFLKLLAYLAGGFETCLCLGNHDYKAYRGDEKGLLDFIADIRALGIRVLHNECTVFEKNNKKYNIIGLEDLRKGKVDFGKAFECESPDVFMNIAISHNPDIVLSIPREKVDYLFCGHFHGGQIWAPFDLEFRMLRYEKLCRMGIKSGLHKVNGVNLYISRGLGNVLVPLRFRSRPEITVVQLP